MFCLRTKIDRLCCLRCLRKGYRADPVGKSFAISLYDLKKLKHISRRMKVLHVSPEEYLRISV